MTSDEKKIIPLSKMGVNKSGIIISLEGGAKFHARLQALNLRIGKRIKKISTNPFRGPIVVEIDRSRLALGHGMANKVMVEITEGDE